MSRWFTRTFFTLPVFLTAAVSAGDIVINEIHFQPLDKTIPDEFVELANTADTEKDISGWFFSVGISYTFPPGTSIPAGGFVVVAEDPETLRGSFLATDPLGPYAGRLDNDGERVVLRNPAGEIEDETDYDVGFPWPIRTSGRGSSMELIHPSLDNDLGGSWRASGMVDLPPTERVFFLGAEETDWHYRKATSEPSDPADAWRRPDFVEDGTWQVGTTSIGFGDGDDNTVLEDMRDNYSGVYLRKAFTIPPEALEDLPRFMKLSLFVDDGCVVWINGVEALRYRVAEGHQPFDALASRAGEARWTDFEILGPAALLVAGQNLIAIHAMNRTLNGADFSIDAQLFFPGSEDYEDNILLQLPTPGAQNSVFAENAPPQIRQVDHLPLQPRDDEPLVISAKITDPEGVSSVRIHYQVVLPGDYISAFLPHPTPTLLSRPLDPLPPNPAFEDPANWSTANMVDDGMGDDVAEGDDVYTVTLPPQINRSLVRYRISATDNDSAAVTVPYKDDESLNFACFIYNGIPPYETTLRSVHPEGAGHVYSQEIMNSLPVYFMITRASDLSQCIAYNSADRIPKGNENARDKFNWECAFVYEGYVYDHVTYRLRQANDRYGGNGKRSMRFRFPRGNYFRVRDNYGKRYPERWQTINTGKMFDNKRVGNFGLTEAMNAILWNLVDVPAPWFHTYHQRVIDGPDEVPAGTSGQYLGDFWGMYSAIEDYDPRFMDAHNLEDGNLYKLKDGIFNGNMLRRNQGRYAVTTDADFQNIRRNLRPTQTAEWLDAHVNYDRWYPYHAVVEGIRHYDFRPADSHSKNRAWYFEPNYEGSEFGRLWTLPWDSDASWGPNWNSGIDYTKNAIFSGGAEKAPFRQKYRNFIREFRDLIWTEEVIHQMVDDLAEFVNEFSDADRDRWRGAPASAGSQDFGPISSKITDMKRFAFVSWSGGSGPTVPAGGRARHLDNLANGEGDINSIPETPTIEPATPDHFPIDGLTFLTSLFQDPQGEDTFGAMKWRVGELHNPNAPGLEQGSRRIYEYPAVWESEVLTTFSNTMTVPPTALKIGHSYRARVRMMDNTGKWSHWSAPVEFTVSSPTAQFLPQANLRVTEIMYHPLSDSSFEFIELQNTGSETMNIEDVSIREGIRFSFAQSEVKSLDPGQYVVVVENRAVFKKRYTSDSILIAGEYSGRLSNGGEMIQLVYGTGLSIQEFEYGDWYPDTDGLGYSLEILDPTGPLANWGLAAGWKISERLHGTPGSDDSGSQRGGQLQGDINQDGGLNLSDAVALVNHLHLGEAERLPCGSGSLEDASNRALLDTDGDENVSLSDAVYVLHYLFLSGPAPHLGIGCITLDGCPDTCSP